MSLLQQAKDVISKLPFKDTLNHIRQKLPDSDNATAYSLPFPDGSSNVAAKLFSIQQHVRGGLVKLDYFYPLVHRIETVFNIIDNLGSLTPPPSNVAPTFKKTPVKSSSSRLSNSKTHNILRSLEDLALNGMPYKLYIIKTAYEFEKRVFKYKDVLIVEEHKSKYIFDQSEAYSSGAFDIYNKPDIFTCALVGYVTIEDDVIGLDTFIERENKLCYIIVDDVNSQETRIRLAKLILKSAEERGVTGIARVVAYCQITTIAQLQKGLKFRKRHKFRSKKVHFENLSSLGTRDTLRYKRKSSSNYRFNTIYSCLVISPASRSLYTTGNILHRDISSNNIIIIKPKAADSFKGMLIDLNLAKVRDSGPSGARHQTGTIQFIAIEVLRKTDHTYRHNLESFFYWSNGFARREEPPKESGLRKWEISSFKDIARTKVSDMTVDGLENIISEFPGSLSIIKPLCLKIRKILFPLNKNERMSFGTPAEDPNQLYNPITAAFDDAIRKIKY
ncbi:hypothetical protein F5Y16DRAFT_411215 [Xylariaceae sp. FL0255]|nr:hypothetical protein F5Y16DRAFT_411215 [Xylariaceae sp. FL0255]